jgi:hypothetical protein
MSLEAGRYVDSYGDLRLGLDYENIPAIRERRIPALSGGISEMEIIVAYGSACLPARSALAGNHFLTITEG